jgi:hypothetical protein
MAQPGFYLPVVYRETERVNYKQNYNFPVVLQDMSLVPST